MQALTNFFEKLCGKEASSAHLDLDSERNPMNFEIEDDQEKRTSQVDLNQELNLDHFDEEEENHEEYAKQVAATAGGGLEDEERVEAIPPPKQIDAEVSVEEAEALLDQDEDVQPAEVVKKEDDEKEEQHEERIDVEIEQPTEVKPEAETEEDPFFGKEEANIEDEEIKGVVKEFDWGTGKEKEVIATIDDKEPQPAEEPAEVQQPKKSMLSFFACGASKSKKSAAKENEDTATVELKEAQPLETPEGIEEAPKPKRKMLSFLFGGGRRRKNKATADKTDPLKNDSESLHGDAIENQVTTHVGLDENTWGKNEGV